MSVQTCPNCGSNHITEVRRENNCPIYNCEKCNLEFMGVSNEFNPYAQPKEEKGKGKAK